MEKNVSIVRVDTRHYRVIARENWGLTKEQMRGKHVHHRIRRSDGGTNDPSNLYVCSSWYHDVVWHGGSGRFIELAAEGGRKGGRDGGKKVHKKKNENGKSLHGIETAKRLHENKDENGKSLAAVKGGKKGGKKVHESKDENGKSLVAVKLNENKGENGKSLNAVKAGKKSSYQVWESTIDGFRSNAGNVAQHNRANGWDSEARIRVK